MIGHLSRQTVRRSWPAYVGALVALSFGTLLLSLTVTVIGATAEATDRPGVTTAELSRDDKDAISHRGKALRELAPMVAAALG